MVCHFSRCERPSLWNMKGNFCILLSDIEKKMATSVISDRNFNVRSVNYAIISCSLSFILSQHANKPRGGIKVCFRIALKKLPDAFKRGKKNVSAVTICISCTRSAPLRRISMLHLISRGIDQASDGCSMSNRCSLR